jgi:hypothetical protein
MLRPHVSGTLPVMVSVLMLMSVRIASAQESWTLKLYDVRDLMGLIPPVEAPEEFPSPATRRTMYDLTEKPQLKPEEEKKDSVDGLMGKLCGAMGAGCNKLFPGVYGVEAEEAQHAELLRLLEEVRSLYGERYEVEIVWFANDCGQTPSVGDVVTPVEPARRHRFVAARHTPTPMSAVSRTHYVADLSPVVATGAAAYDPQTRSAEDGLQLSVLVGGGMEESDTTAIRVVGELQHMSGSKSFGPIGGRVSADPKAVEIPGIELELPTVSVRSIRSDLRITYDSLTTLCVLDGLEAGKCFVVAASVRKLAD